MDHFITIVSIALPLFLSTSSAAPYCVPHTIIHTTTGAKYVPSKCWPSVSTWNALQKELTGSLSVLNPTSKSYAKTCDVWHGNSTEIARRGHGMCMQYPCCSKVLCEVTGRWNIPAYSVEARDVRDIQTSLAFATKHNIAVTIKTSGHNMAGSSTGYGTLLIWMHSFQKYGCIMDDFKTSCGTPYKNVLHIGGGQPWSEAYAAAGEKFHLIGGQCGSVSAAGGWLMGGGSSMMSRMYGMGIDNVLKMEVVLADGRHVVADKCSNPDLFWALRGGGGGTFGVLTAAYYQLHPAEPIVYGKMYITVNGTFPFPWTPFPKDTAAKFIDFWVDKSLHLDKRWGALFTPNTIDLYFVGSMADAERTFLNDLKAWYKALPTKKQKDVRQHFKTYKNYYTKHKDDFEIPTGTKKLNVANRIVPRDWVVKNVAKTKDTLKWLMRNGPYMAYFLGGVEDDVGVNDTALHPDTRSGLYEVNTMGSDAMIEKIRTVWKSFGSGYNGACKYEADWLHQFWGSNAERLVELKKKYDPGNRFNCWFCVGYKKMQEAPPEPSAHAPELTPPETIVF